VEEGVAVARLREGLNKERGNEDAMHDGHAEATAVMAWLVVGWQPVVSRLKTIDLFTCYRTFLYSAVITQQTTRRQLLTSITTKRRRRRLKSLFFTEIKNYIEW